MIVRLLVFQTFLTCCEFHECTLYFASILQIHFQRCLSHMRFASLNASRWTHCSRKKCTHFLIVLSQSQQHDQRPKQFALQIRVQVDMECWVVLPPSTLLLDSSRRSTSNHVFGKSPYQYLVPLGWIKVPSSCEFSNKQTHERPPSNVPRVAAPDARTSSILHRWYTWGKAVQYIGGCRSENGIRIHLLYPTPQ